LINPARLHGQLLQVNKHLQEQVDLYVLLCLVVFYVIRAQFVASGGAGGELRVWDLASREMVAHMKHHTMAITDLKVL